VTTDAYPLQGHRELVNNGQSLTMPSTTSEKTILHSSVDLEFAERVRQAAEHEDRSVSYLIRRALTRELSAYEPEPLKRRQA
jgi:Ribbon-helix-helix protein, copG family